MNNQDYKHPPVIDYCEYTNSSNFRRKVLLFPLMLTEWEMHSNKLDHQ